MHHNNQNSPCGESHLIHPELDVLGRRHAEPHELLAWPGCNILWPRNSLLGVIQPRRFSCNVKPQLGQVCIDSAMLTWLRLPEMIAQAG